MDPINILRDALSQIREPRLFQSERGYSAELLAEIHHVLNQQEYDVTRPIAEAEYQKRLKEHGLRFRPDIVVHIPFDRGVSPTRRHDNLLVIMLKLAGSQAKADEDFGKLSQLCKILDYPVGAFVNVRATDLCLPNYNSTIEGPYMLHEFAVTLREGLPVIREASRRQPRFGP